MFSPLHLSLATLLAMYSYFLCWLGQIYPVVWINTGPDITQNIKYMGPLLDYTAAHKIESHSGHVGSQKNVACNVHCVK